MNIKKKLKARNEGFSLIELMIVIVIIGALTAIILPQFDMSESEAKDAGCDASNYGTLSQLTKYNSVHGAYPSRMHTGYEAAAGADDNIMGTNNSRAMAGFTAANYVSGASPVALGDGTGGTVNRDSLLAAGIRVLASGGYGEDIAWAQVASDPANVATVDAPWYEAWQTSATTGLPEEGTLDTASDPVTINGLEMYRYAQTDKYSTVSDPEKNGVIVPLFLATTTEWEHYYDPDGNQNDSKIGVAQAGGCPWLDGAEDFRYYIGFYKVFNDGSPAKLIGTTCPECGSLNP